MHIQRVATEVGYLLNCDKPILSSERMLQKDNDRKGSGETNL
jgi:hypothetical protein